MGVVMSRLKSTLITVIHTTLMSKQNINTFVTQSLNIKSIQPNIKMLKINTLKLSSSQRLVNSVSIYHGRLVILTICEISARACDLFKDIVRLYLSKIFTRSRHCFGFILILFLTSIKLFNGIFITMLRSATTIEFDDNDSSQ